MADPAIINLKDGNVDVAAPGAGRVRVFTKNGRPYYRSADGLRRLLAEGLDDYGSVTILPRFGTSATYRATTDTDAARGTALVAGIAATAAGDAIIVGPGVFDLGGTQITVPAASRLRGAGRRTTTIRGTTSSVGLVVGSSNSTVSDLTIEQLATGFALCLAGTGITNLTAQNVRCIGDSDCFYMVNSSARLFGCEADCKWDCVFSGGTSVVEVFGGSFVTTGPSTLSATEMGAIQASDGGILRLYGSRVRASTATANSGRTIYGVRAYGGTALVELTGCSVVASAPDGTIRDAMTGGSGTPSVSISGGSGGGTNGAFVTSGTINYLSAPVQRALSSLSAAGTTLGSVTKKIPVTDATGAVVGYLPVYDTIT